MEDGPPRFPRDFTCPTVLRNITGSLPVSCTGVSPSLPCLPRHFHYLPQCRCVSPTTPHEHARTVWAVPRSLATTEGVSIDFLSSGYVDVSVPRVGSAEAVTGVHPAGFPHSGISGSSPVCRLPEAYRRLLRPSSPPDAKASTMCPSLLIHQDVLIESTCASLASSQ